MKNLRRFQSPLIALLCLAGHAATEAQTVPYATSISPEIRAGKLAEDRGAAGLQQTLRKLNTWASLMMITAHPDDEDGGMLTYESRGLGVRTALFTLTRGEGGQNAMSGESYDALGLIRNYELLRADTYYATEQYWGTVADFGFSKTIEESFSKWGKERVLYDAVRSVRMNRPLVVASVFLGGITDGHGQHQVAGEITQEVFKAAGDPKIFPDQIAAGLRPWSPRKVYARSPLFSVGPQGMFDYATGKWAPVRFYNYVDQRWSTQSPEVNIEIPSGTYDPLLGRSYIQISREGWGEQKTQNGGGFIVLSGPATTQYHRYGSLVATTEHEKNFFDGIDASIEGLASLAPGKPVFLREGLHALQQQITSALANYQPSAPDKIAPQLREGLLQTGKLLSAIRNSQLPDEAKGDLTHELEIKQTQFNTALAQALGLEITAVRTASANATSQNLNAGETSQAITPGENFFLRVHATTASPLAKLEAAEIQTPEGENWKIASTQKVSTNDTIFQISAAENAAPTKAFYSRPDIEQPYYDISSPNLRNSPITPYPVTGWAIFDYDGAKIKIGQVAQSVKRIPGPGSILEPLVVTPRLSVSLSPEGGALPLTSKSFSITAKIHGQTEADGSIHLKLPSGWTSEPENASFHLAKAGEEASIPFNLHVGSLSESSYSIQAVVESNGRSYTEGWQTVGYPGVLPSNFYRPAITHVRAIDVKITPGLKVGYVMGTGDSVPEALTSLGVATHILTDEELANGALDSYDAIVIGIRAYTVRPALHKWSRKLMEYVNGGGNLVVQYQSADFPSPYSLTLGSQEKVVEELAPVKLLTHDHPLLQQPNLLTEKDFDGWVEERGHSFAASWDSHFIALTETADQGQDPQKGGLLTAIEGKGRYTYVAFALHRQLPEQVAGAYRLLANLVSKTK